MTVDTYVHARVTQMEDQSQVIRGDVQVEGISQGNELFDSSRGVLAKYQGKEWAEDPELGVTSVGLNREEKENYV